MGSPLFILTLLSLQYFGCVCKNIPHPGLNKVHDSIAKNYPVNTRAKSQKSFQLVCEAIGPFFGNPAFDNWCNQNCNHVPTFCPETFCKCISENDKQVSITTGAPVTSHSFQLVCEAI